MSFRSQGCGWSLLERSLIPDSWVHPFQKCFELTEAFAPEGAVEVEPVNHRRERVWPGAIVSFAAFATMPYQLRALQHGEMFGDGWLGDAGITGQCVDGLFALS